MSWFRPARGCSCAGSYSSGPLRKEDTSWASDGSNGAGWKGVDVEDCDGLLDEFGDCDDELVEVDLRPVRVSQIAMILERVFLQRNGCAGVDSGQFEWLLN